MTTHFRCNFLLQEISFFLWYWALIFYRHMVGLSVFELTSYTSLRNLTWKELMAYGTSVLLLGLYLWNPRRIVDYTSMTGHYHQSWGKDYTCQPTFSYGSLTLYLLRIPPWSKQPAPLAATLLWKLLSSAAPVEIPIQFHERFLIPYTATPLLIPSIL